MIDTIDCTTGGEVPAPAPVFGYPLRMALGYVPPGGWNDTGLVRIGSDPLPLAFPIANSGASAAPGRGYDASHIMRNGNTA